MVPVQAHFHVILSGLRELGEKSFVRDCELVPELGVLDQLARDRLRDLLSENSIQYGKTRAERSIWTEPKKKKKN